LQAIAATAKRKSAVKNSKKEKETASLVRSYKV